MVNGNNKFKLQIKRVFGERLKELRLEKGLTQKQLANILKVAPNTISSWEMGYTDTRCSKIKEIAIFFNVRVNYLLGLDDKRIK